MSSLNENRNGFCKAILLKQAIIMRFWSNADPVAARNSQIFEEEQLDLFTLKKQISAWRKHAEARRNQGDLEGAKLRDRLADKLSEEVDDLDILCSDRVFQKKNAGLLTVHKIDLHCLLPHQALRHVERELLVAQALFDSGVKAELHIVTGHGVHSQGRAAVKIAVTDWLTTVGCEYYVNDNNKGLICVPIVENDGSDSEPSPINDCTKYTDKEWDAWQAEWDTGMYTEDTWRRSNMYM